MNKIETKMLEKPKCPRCGSKRMVIGSDAVLLGVLAFGSFVATVCCLGLSIETTFMGIGILIGILLIIMTVIFFCASFYFCINHEYKCLDCKKRWSPKRIILIKLF